jgi:hypothetical protein
VNGGMGLRDHLDEAVRQFQELMRNAYPPL